MLGVVNIHQRVKRSPYNCQAFRERVRFHWNNGMNKFMSHTCIWNHKSHEGNEQGTMFVSSPGGSNGKEPACWCRLDARTAGLVRGSGGSPGGMHSSPLQYACLESPVDRGAWWATVHRVTESRTWLKWLSTHTCTMLAWKRVVWPNLTCQGSLSWENSFCFEN